MVVNLGPLATEIGPVVWGTPANFNGFRVLAALLHAARHCSSGRQPNFAALTRGRHLYSAGRPSRWALAHISSWIWLICFDSIFIDKTSNTFSLTWSTNVGKITNNWTSGQVMWHRAYGCIAATHGWFNRIRQVAWLQWTPQSSIPQSALTLYQCCSVTDYAKIIVKWLTL